MTARGDRTPGELALHPLALVGLAVLLLNDHVLKALAPGWLTGKLSDVAGLLFFPFLLLALVDVVRRRREPGLRAAALAAAATAGAFTAVKVWEPARTVYCWAIGVLRYPFDAVTSVLAGAGAGPLTRAVVTPDASDLIAVGACAVVVLVARRRSRCAPPYSGMPSAQVATTAASTAVRS